MKMKLVQLPTLCSQAQMQNYGVGDHLKRSQKQINF